MYKLNVKADVDSVVICGEFCNWELDKAIVAKKKPRNKFIVVPNMPKGEYKVFDSRSYFGGEVYPNDKRDMGNRYFADEFDEYIRVYFR